MNLFIKQTFTDLGNEFMVTGVWRVREMIAREFGMDMYTLLYLKWITIKDLLYSIGNSVQCYVTNGKRMKKHRSVSMYN